MENLFTFPRIRTHTHMKFLASIILFGMLLLAQGKALDHGGVLHTPCSATCIDAPAYLEHVLASVRARIERGAATYPEALEAESRLLQEQIATGLDQDGEIMKRLQAVYQELISYAERAYDKAAAITYRLKLLDVTSPSDHRAAVIDCYRQLVEFRQQQLQHGAGTQDLLLLAEIDYLLASLPERSSEQQEIDKKEIQKKRRLLEKMYEAYHQPK